MEEQHEEPREANQPIIWDCVGELEHEHPPLYLASCRVKEKIEKCLCQSYDIVDPPEEKDHKSVLLSLKGTIRVETSTTEPSAYGFCDARGIAINAELVAASDGIFSVYRENFMSNIDGLSYVCILEETIEHELGHLKNHQQLMNNPTFSQDTKKESPLKGESGYAVQRATRLRFGEEDNPQILQASDACHERQFRPPVEVRWLAVVKSPLSRAKNIHPTHTLSFEELKLHMSHPPDDHDECSKADAKADSKLSSRQKRLRRRRPDDNNPDGSSGGGGPSIFGPSSKAARRDGSASSESKPRFGSGRGGGSRENSRSAATAAKEQQSCTDSNGLDPHVEIYDQDEYVAACYSTQHCNIDIQLCDKNRDPKEKFVPEENIYILLKYSNPTENDVYAEVHGGGPDNIDLGRGGAQITIRGKNKSYTPTPAVNKLRMVKIAPGSAYTFFRKFCVSRSSSGYKFYGSWTPEEVGKYTAVVSCILKHGKSHELGDKEFEIVEK